MTGVVTLNAWSAWAHTCVLGCLLSALSAPAPLRATTLETDPSVPTAIPPETARARIAALRAEIARHDELYFRRAAPEISDAAYDRLKRELRELERAFPEPAAGPPAAAALGDDRTGDFPSVRHRERMLGLDKAYDETELRAFHARVARQLSGAAAEFVVEPKYDGLAISVTYERGRFVRAVTRGNGREGDDITENVRTIAALPRTLPAAGGGAVPDLIEVRGELFVPWAEFRRINDEQEADGLPAFAHPRNLAAGTAKLHAPEEVASRRLAVVFYGWGACEPAAARPESQRRFLGQLRAWGLPTLEPIGTARTADELCVLVREFGRRRAKLPFPTDGTVVKLDALAPRVALGDSDTAPHWAIAYKFAPETAATRLRAITVQIGRTGVLTPVAELAPVRLGGSTVARATLHNPAQIARLDLRIGDTVFVEKSGEIIPAITGVDFAQRPSAATPFVFPAECPACRTAVVQGASESTVLCPNAACPGQLRRRLQHFASKSCVGIDGLGPAAIDTLVERGLLRDLPDLYRLRRADLLPLPRFGPSSADVLLAAIERSKRAELWRVIHGLGLPEIGAAKARALARQFPDLLRLAEATPEELAACVPAATARRLHEHLSRPGTRALLHELQAQRLAGPSVTTERHADSAARSAKSPDIAPARITP